MKSIDNIDSYVFYLADKGNFKNILISYLIIHSSYYLLWNSLIWILIYSKGNSNPSYIKKAITASLIIYFLIIIIRNISFNLQTKLTSLIYEEHQTLLIYILNNTNRSILLDQDLTEIAINSRFIMDYIPVWLDQKMIYVNIFGKIISILIASRKINIVLIFSLLIIFQLLIFIFQRNYIDTEQKKINEINDINIYIRRQIENSKIKIINDIFNEEHYTDLVKELNANYTFVEKSRATFNLLSDLGVLVITIFIIFIKFNSISLYTKLLYFIIVKDINVFFDLVIKLYRLRPVSEKVNIAIRRMNVLYNKIEIKHNFQYKNIIDNLKIIKFKCNNPLLSINNELIFKINEPTLIDGKSGSGKTTFFKCLKGITSCILETFPSNIHSKIYFCSQSSKPYESKTLFSYITNSSKTPDINLINKCLKIVRMEHRFDLSKDCKFNINNISGGEGTRLALAQILYDILTHNFDIILLDEMDSNLDSELALNIFKDLIQILNHKIVLMSVHNDNLKSLFKNVVKF
jgi:ABC-type lipoprotein export system ATPase subunit